MQKKYVYVVLGVIVLGAAGVLLANLLAGPDAGGTAITTTDQVIENPRPTPKARGNTFGIMTPEEKAAAEEAARLAALAASSSASSTATSTATTTDEIDES